MPNLKWQWDKVRTGQMITFRYHNKTRTVFVLNPKLQLIKKDGSITELLHGIQFEEDKIKNLKLYEIIKVINNSGILGRLVVENNIQYYGVQIKDPIKAYEKLKLFLRDRGVYKTFTVKNIRRSKVFIDDYKFPRAVFLKSNIKE